MAIAGRVAIVPKGDWSADATYKRLDAVTHNNTLYFAKKEVPAGTATSNTEYWSKSIVGGAGGVATADEAGVVKPADGLSIAEDGTLKVSIDGTTLTMDQVNNVIKLADTLKEKINGAFPAANVANNQITTVEGFALDARQANPNIDGTLAKQLSDLNGSLNTVFYAIKEVEDANDAEPGAARIDVGTNNHNPFPNFHTILLTIPFVELSGGYSIQFGMSIAAQYNGKLAVRTKDSNNWGEWAILSDINDISNIGFKDVSDKLDTTHMTGSIAYCNIGRIVMVYFDVLPVAVSDNTTILPTGTLPKAYVYAYHSVNTWGQNNVADSLMAVGDDGSLALWSGSQSINSRIFDSFIYFSKP